MMIYAIFLCMSGQCHMIAPGRETFSGYVPAETYSSLAECERKIKIIAPYPLKDMTYKCLGKHVDQWEQLH